MSTEDIERVTKAHEVALSTLLLEFEALTDKELSRLDRRYSHLCAALQQVKDSRRVFQDVVFAEAAQRLATEQLENDNLVAMVQIADDDGGWTWWAFPEVNGHRFEQNGTVTFFRMRHDSQLLVRNLPRGWVGEVRNVPKDHPIALAAPQWTIANQGQPDWEDELVSLEPEIQDMANNTGVPVDRLRDYVADEGYFPDQQWIESAIRDANEAKVQ